MRSEIDHPDIPQGMALIASDDVAKEFFMLHFDERGISRKYDVTITENGLTWTRNNPEFSQRFVLTMEENGKNMVGKGEMCSKGGAWEDDIQLTYERCI
jgi:hypothetical protein